MNKSNCYDDKDCGKDKMCIFDFTICKNKIKCQNICINKEEYYNNPSCINNKKYSDLNSDNINKNLNLNNKKECISWAKEQECTKNNNCNSIIYRHKQHSILDIFKGFGKIFSDKIKHNIETSDHKKLKLHQNKYIKDGYDKSKSSINYNYKCTNNGGEYKSGDVQLKTDINISCPIDKKDEKFKNVCAVLNIDDKDIKPYNNLNCDLNHHINYTLPKTEEELLEFDKQKLQEKENNKLKIIEDIKQLKDKYNTIEHFDISINKTGKVHKSLHATSCFWNFDNNTLNIYGDSSCDISKLNKSVLLKDSIGKGSPSSHETLLQESQDISNNFYKLSNKFKGNEHNLEKNLRNMNEKLRTKIEDEKKDENILMNIIKYLLIILTVLVCITIAYFIFTQVIKEKKLM